MWKVKTSVMPPAANTYFCCAPRLCPVCVEAREAERKLLYRRALAAQHCPWDQGDQFRVRAEREYQKAMMPESHAGIAPAPANCENSLKQKALEDKWESEQAAMEAESLRRGHDRRYLQRLAIQNMVAAERGHPPIPYGVIAPDWDYAADGWNATTAPNYPPESKRSEEWSVTWGMMQFD